MLSDHTPPLLTDKCIEYGSPLKKSSLKAPFVLKRKLRKMAYDSVVTLYHVNT